MNRYIVSSLEQQLRNDPTSRVFLRLAEEFRKGGMYDKAVRVCEDGLRHHPRYVPAWVCLGRCHESLSRPLEAEKAFSQVLEFSSDNPHALRGLGVIALNRRLFDEARLYFERLLIQEPADEQILDWLQQCEDGAVQLEAERMAQDIDPTRTVEITKGSRGMIVDQPLDDGAADDEFPANDAAAIAGVGAFDTNPDDEEPDADQLEADEEPSSEPETLEADDDAFLEADAFDEVEPDEATAASQSMADMDREDAETMDAFDELEATISDSLPGLPIEGRDLQTLDDPDDDFSRDEAPVSAFEPEVARSALDFADEAEDVAVPLSSASAPGRDEAISASEATEVEADEFEAAPETVQFETLQSETLQLETSLPEAELLDDDELEMVEPEPVAAVPEPAVQTTDFDFDFHPESDDEAEKTASLLAEDAEEGEKDAIDLHFERALSGADDELLEDDLVTAAPSPPNEPPPPGDPLSSEEFEHKMTQGLKHEKMEHFEQAEQIYRLLLRHRPGDVVITGHLQRLLGVLAGETKKRKKVRKLSNWLDKIKGVYDVS